MQVKFYSLAWSNDVIESSFTSSVLQYGVPTWESSNLLLRYLVMAAMDRSHGYLCSVYAYLGRRRGCELDR